MLVLLACVDPGPVPSDPSARVDTGSSGFATAVAVDTADSAATDSAPPDDGLVGRLLDPALAPPTFAVLDQAGEVRTEAWLAGHPTVLWFFREAEGTT